MTLNHIHIGTKNLSDSVQFYTKYFNFKKKFDHGEGIFISSDDNKFLLAIDPVQILPEWPSWFHYGFCLGSEAEVLTVYNQMKQGNVKIARDLMLEKNEFASFFAFDPDGYKIEISWHKE